MSPPPSVVVGAVVVEGVIVMEIGVWRVGGELALLQTGNLYVPAAAIVICIYICQRNIC